MVDEETIPDLCAGMNINTGFFVGPLGHHPRNEWYPQAQQLMGQALEESLTAAPPHAGQT